MTYDGQKTNHCICSRFSVFSRRSVYLSSNLAVENGIEIDMHSRIICKTVTLMIDEELVRARELAVESKLLFLLARLQPPKPKEEEVNDKREITVCELMRHKLIVLPFPQGYDCVNCGRHFALGELGGEINNQTIWHKEIEEEMACPHGSCSL